MPSAYQLLKNVPPDSLRIRSETKRVRVDDAPDESELTYLDIHGTPEAFRWLSQLLGELASTAENSNDPKLGHSVIFSPHDLKQITMTEWWGVDLFCRREMDENHPS